MHCSTTLPPPGFCNRHVDKMSNGGTGFPYGDRKSTRLNSSHDQISYAVFCLKKKNSNGHHHEISRNAEVNHSIDAALALERDVIQRVIPNTQPPELKRISRAACAAAVTHRAA